MGIGTGSVSCCWELEGGDVGCLQMRSFEYGLLSILQTDQIVKKYCMPQIDQCARRMTGSVMTKQYIAECLARAVSSRRQPPFSGRGARPM